MAGEAAAAGERLEEVVHLVQRPLRVRAVLAPQAAEPQVLVDGQLGDDPAALRHVRHPAAHHLLDPDPAQVLAVEQDPAPGRPEQTREGTQQRRLPRAVRTEYGGDGTGSAPPGRRRAARARPRTRP
nr:hypothetical protein GCM10020092_012280 [Actinoplanes digitatis]